MSLVRTVTELVKQRGQATVDELMPVGNYTRKQIKQALKNAAAHYLLTGESRGTQLLIIYRPFEGERPVEKPVKRRKPIQKPPASVWELADTEQGAWPPVFEDARKFMLLGEW